MAIELPKSIAVTGFLPFDLADLQDIWTNLNDGNYYSAFKRAVSLLNLIINAPPNVGVGAGLRKVDDEEKVDESFDRIQTWCDQNAEAVHEPHALKSGEPNLTAVPIADIVALMRTLLQFYQMWKQQKGSANVSNKNPKFAKLRGNPPAETPAITPTVANTQVPPVNPAPTVEAAKQAEAAKEAAKEVEALEEDVDALDLDEPSVANTAGKESDAMRKMKENEAKKNATKKGHK